MIKVITFTTIVGVDSVNRVVLRDRVDGVFNPSESIRPGVIHVLSYTKDGYVIIKLHDDSVTGITQECFHDMLAMGAAVSYEGCLKWLRTFKGESDMDFAAQHLFRLLAREHVSQALLKEVATKGGTDLNG